MDHSLSLSLSQYGAAGGEDPESSGPASQRRQRFLGPVREDLPAARQEEEVSDQGAGFSLHPPLLLLRNINVQL